MIARWVVGGLLVLGLAGIVRAEDEAAAAGELADWLDARFVALWEQDGRQPPEVIDDATYLRRVSLDLVGTIPSVAEARDFLADTDPAKRARLVERLLADRRHAEHLARVWRRVLVPSNSPNAGIAVQLEPWLQQQFAGNVPYDEFTRRLLTATAAAPAAMPAGVVNVRTTGAALRESPLAFYQAVGSQPPEVAGAVTRVFLGVRLGCAKCHDHPFAQWKQRDFWGMAAFFAGTQAGNGLTETSSAGITGEDGRHYDPTFLGGDEAKISDGKLPRQVLAEWMTATDNRNFAATAVNRVWQHLLGRGLISPVDDLDLASPEERALVLDDLAARFVAAKFDMRWLIQGICRSRFYQSPSVSPEEAERDGLAFRRPLKTLTPEQVFDALEQALMLPVTNNDGSPRYNGQRAALVARLAEGMGDTPEQYRQGIPQVLMLMNGRLTASATNLDDSRTLRAVIEAPFLEPEQKITTLYLAAFTRRPRPEETDFLLKHTRRQTTDAGRREAYAEIFWALLNSPEFVLCR